MELVTIHDLSRQFNIPSRVVRYRLQKLIVAGKLKEGEDFQREDFKDDQHFVWKINPLSFMRETGLQRISPPPKMTLPVNETGNSSATPDNNLGNQSFGATNLPAHSEIPPVNTSSTVVNQTAHSDNKTVNNAGDEAAARAEDRAFEREMIDFMKEQIKTKDELIRDQGKQLREEKELNRSLNSALLQQGQKIENLMRLTGGKMEMAETMTKPAGEEKTVDSHAEAKQAA